MHYNSEGWLLVFEILLEVDVVLALFLFKEGCGECCAQQNNKNRANTCLQIGSVRGTKKKPGEKKMLSKCSLVCQMYVFKIKSRTVICIFLLYRVSIVKLKLLFGKHWKTTSSRGIWQLFTWMESYTCSVRMSYCLQQGVGALILEVLSKPSHSMVV